jgi:hypothetical protein
MNNSSITGLIIRAKRAVNRATMDMKNRARIKRLR